jgi:membrane-associated phospholipid phosphatase
MRRSSSGSSLAVVLAVVLATARQARGDEPEPPADPDTCATPVHLSPEGGRFDLPDLLLTAGSGITILVAALVGPTPRHARGGVLVDEDVRDALRIGDENGRRAARDASDALLNVMLAFPFLVDAAAYTAWYRGSREVAWNLALVNLETMALTEGVRTAFNVLVSRERPYGRECGGALPNRAFDCDARSRYYSFFSGHASQTFASAALTCSHHLNLDLYGGGWADAAPCLAGFGLAATTALLRVVGDVHYLSDVLVGAAFGTAMGFTVPWLVLHRRRGRARPEADAGGAEIVLVPMAGGAGLAGVF